MAMLLVMEKWMKLKGLLRRSRPSTPDYVMAFEPIWELVPAQMLYQMLPLPQIFRTILVTSPDDLSSLIK